MNPEIVNPAIKAIRETIAEYGRKLEAIKPNDPAHWAPNVLHACQTSINMTSDRMLADHWVGKRHKADSKAHEARRSKLAAEIVALPEWQALSSEVGSFLTHWRERLGLTLHV